MTPLEKIKEKYKKVCCNNCKNAVNMYGSYYCAESGKLILSLNLDTDRPKQCDGRFIAKRIS